MTAVLSANGLQPRYLVTMRSGMPLEEWLVDSEQLKSPGPSRADLLNLTFLRVVRDVLDALEALHAAGVSHGRLTPNAIFFDPAGAAAAQNGDPRAPVAVLGTLFRLRPLPSTDSGTAYIRGEMMISRPEEFLYDLNRVLHPTAAGQGFERRLAERFSTGQSARADGAPHRWLIAQDLWSVGVIILCFLCTQIPNAQWNQAAISTGQAARGWVRDLINRLRQQHHSDHALLFRLAELLCLDVATLSADALRSDCSVGRLPCGVLGLAPAFVAELQRLRRDLSSAITTECEGRPRYFCTADDMPRSVRACADQTGTVLPSVHHGNLVDACLDCNLPFPLVEDVCRASVRVFFAAHDENPASDADGPSVAAEFGFCRSLVRWDSRSAGADVDGPIGAGRGSVLDVGGDIGPHASRRRAP
uniref:Protein kinase domain-containing protein n=1 Tax=Neobodo designis TaxID=312471 RepID=A0A7S1W0V3_NEODS